ncbi:hypothetical protein WKT02_05500 [Erysipelotrichaceae bacterium HCN-30851]
MDSLDSDTYTSSSQGKGYNAFHLNASYDLLEHTYDDVILQGEAHKDENGAFNELVDLTKAIKPSLLPIEDMNHSIASSMLFIQTIAFLSE